MGGPPINDQVRPLLRTRTRRLLRLIELNAPPVVIAMSMWMVFRTTWALVPGEMARQFSMWLTDRMLTEAGLCHFCEDKASANRQIDPQFGMCVECWADAMDDSDLPNPEENDEDDADDEQEQ